MYAGPSPFHLARLNQSTLGPYTAEARTSSTLTAAFSIMVGKFLFLTISVPPVIAARNKKRRHWGFIPNAAY
jgi:hypothetical protein